MAFAVTLSPNTNPSTDFTTASIDEDIAMFVGTKLILMSQNCCSSPEGYRCSGDGESNFNQWKLDLMRHGQALVNYARYYMEDSDDAQVQSAQEFLDEVQELETGYVNFAVPAQKAMHWVADNFADLWS